MKISDEVLAGVRLVSGDANDPISTNETLTNLFTRKPVAIDHAYIMLTPKETIGLGDFAWNPITLYAGKFTNTFFKPRAVMVSELIFDDDLSPEGLAETFTLYEGSEGLLRRFQLNAAQWVTGTIDLSRLQRVRETGEMRNYADWSVQPGAGSPQALAGGVEAVSMK